MTIALISSNADSLLGFRLPLIRHLLAAGHRLSVLVPDPDARVQSRLANLGVVVIAVPLSRTGLNPLADLLYVWRLRRELSGLGADAVIAYTHKPCVYGMIAARLAGVPQRCALITGLGYPFMEEPGLGRAALRLAMRYLYRLSSRATTAFVFQNPDDLAQFQYFGIVRPGHRVVLVGGSGVPLDEFVPSPTPDVPRFLMLARLLVSKGVGLYIDAAQKVRSQSPSAEFTLAGSADNSPDSICPRYREMLDSGRWVAYLGKINDVSAEIRLSSAVILPSYYREGVPRSLLEALACGRPVITTDMPGCREVLVAGVLGSGPGWERRPNGYLIKPRSSDALASAIADFLRLDLPARQAMGRESRCLAEARFDANMVSRDIEDVLI